LYHPYFREFKKERKNFTNSVNMNSPVNVMKMLQRPPKPPSPPKPKPKSPSPPKPKPKSPSPPKPVAKVSDECGKKAQPVTGIGAQKLTTQEMIDLIKRRGQQVPKGKPSREELCAVIKEHGLVVTPKPKVVLPFEAAKIKQFIASQNVVVEKPAAAAVPFLSEKKLWDLHTKKLTNEIYETIPKDGEYENRMNQARDKAVKLVRNMKARGEAPPPYYKK
jgi:hypothetical protein